MPSAAEVSDALDRVLKSDTFTRSERARDLLRYLITQDLAGNADRLKGFSIAVDVFGRDGSFDPSTDPVVRVQAGRLRDLLDQYYANEGIDEMLRIFIPRGTYVPLYMANEYSNEEAQSASSERPGVGTVLEETTPAHPSPAARAPRALFGVTGMVAIAGILFLLAAGTFAFIWNLSRQEASELAAKDDTRQLQVDTTAAVEDGQTNQLPSVYMEVISDQPDTQRIISVLRRGLTAFDTINFISKGVPSTEEAYRPTDFIFVVRHHADHTHIEVQHAMSGKVLLSQAMMIDTDEDLENSVAELLTTVLPASGLIYSSLAQDGIETQLTRCLRLTVKYYRTQNSRTHRDAYECLVKLAETDYPSPLIYSELASLHIQAIRNRYDYPSDLSNTQALNFAQMAVQLGLKSPLAHRSMGYVLSQTADAGEALRWAQRAYELNIYDFAMAASYGYSLIFAGRYEEGVPVLERSVQVVSAHPIWWNYGLSLGQFMLDALDAAVTTIANLAGSDRADYLALRLAIQFQLGRLDDAAELREMLQQKYPDFIADVEGFYERANYPQDLIDKLVLVLRKAGVADGINGL